MSRRQQKGASALEDGLRRVWTVVALFGGVLVFTSGLMGVGLDAGPDDVRQRCVGDCDGACHMNSGSTGKLAHSASEPPEGTCGCEGCRRCEGA